MALYPSGRSGFHPSWHNKKWKEKIRRVVFYLKKKKATTLPVCAVTVTARRRCARSAPRRSAGWRSPTRPPSASTTHRPPSPTSGSGCASPRAWVRRAFPDANRMGSIRTNMLLKAHQKHSLYFPALPTFVHTSCVVRCFLVLLLVWQGCIPSHVPGNSAVCSEIQTKLRETNNASTPIKKVLKKPHKISFVGSAFLLFRLLF